jgi:hypothetical protein
MRKRAKDIRRVAEACGGHQVSCEVLGASNCTMKWYSSILSLFLPSPVLSLLLKRRVFDIFLSE